MSILNMASDGLFSVLIILVRASIHLGPKARDDLLAACGSAVDAIDAQKLSQTLTRWSELGLFETREGAVALREPYRTQLGQQPDRAEERLPKIARSIVLAEENNQLFWESEENKSADFSRGMSWILAQDVYTLDTSSHQKIGALEGKQIRDTAKRILQNDTRWNGLRTWMVYLGFARSGAHVTIDPTIALRDALPEIFGDEQTLPAKIFIERAALALPVLDGGAYRAQIEALLEDTNWTRPSEDAVSTSLSRALQRLDREGALLCEQRSDAPGGIVLTGANQRQWRNITHVQRSASGRSNHA